MTDEENVRTDVGILTEDQRRFLTGDKTYEGEYAAQNRYEMRKAIKNRVYHAILDFKLLYEHLDGPQLEGIFGPQEDRRDEHDISLGLRRAVQFIYKGVDQFSRDQSFEALIEGAVWMAEYDRGNPGVEPAVYVNRLEEPAAAIEATAERIKEHRFTELSYSELLRFIREYSNTDNHHPDGVAEYGRRRMGSKVPRDVKDMFSGESGKE